MIRIFDSISSKTKEGMIHGVILIFENDGEFIPQASNCTCEWGSIWRWSKTNKTIMCVHIAEALKVHDKKEAKRMKDKIEERKFT